MITAEAANRQLAATSKFRQRPVFEWSKQLSRETAPYFVTRPHPNIRQNLGGEPPRRHCGRIMFDRVEGRSEGGSDDEREDIRDYHPRTHEEIHPHCSVDIKRTLPRTDVFTKPVSGGDPLDPFKYPGWVKNTHSNWSTAKKDSTFQRDADETEALDPNVSTVLRRAPCAVIGKAQRLAANPEDGRTALETSFVQRHCGSVSFARASLRNKRVKPSEGYRSLMLNDTQQDSFEMSKSRITAGFAPVRHNHRLTLKDLLGQTAADVRRARSVMSSYFGDRTMSSVRSTYLYTPPPMHDGEE